MNQLDVYQSRTGLRAKQARRTFARLTPVVVAAVGPLPALQHRSQKRDSRDNVAPQPRARRASLRLSCASTSKGSSLYSTISTHACSLLSGASGKGNSSSISTTRMPGPHQSSTKYQPSRLARIFGISARATDNSIPGDRELTPLLGLQDTRPPAAPSALEDASTSRTSSSGQHHQHYEVLRHTSEPHRGAWVQVSSSEPRKRSHTGEHNSSGGEVRGGWSGDTPEHVSVDFKAPVQKEPFGATAGQIMSKRNKPLEIGSLWGLLVLGIAYVHHSTAGFALPALLPAITQDLHLSDGQGAALTAGYTMLYAVALIPVGLLADRVDRPRLLAAGLVLWSLLTVAAAHTHSFGELLFTRVLFAVAQATQNPICFSLIPELFPNARITAMSFYNAAIYLGRALSFAVAILAENLGVIQQPGAENMVLLVPLDKLDLTHVSILYTQGDMAAIVPIYDYRINLANAAAAAATSGADAGGEGWRQLMQWLGPPGLLIAVLCLLTVDEPRAGRGFLPDPLQSSKFTNPITRKFNRSSSDTFLAKEGSVSPKKHPQQTQHKFAETFRQLKELLASKAFQSVTLAATLNDVGSWALISWHATFYARVYNLPAETYAPLLAVVVPLGGLLGGVGGGLMGDRLSRAGQRHWLTAGACIAAAPLVAVSILAPDYRVSFAALLVGFALAEAWRAPAAVIVRDVSPIGMGSTAASVHLCIRNIIGGFGPIGVALLAEQADLQQAMLLVPACLLLSGIGFFFTERQLASREPGSGGPQQPTLVPPA